MADEGFQIAEAFVQISARDTGLRDSVIEKIRAAAAGQSIEVGVTAKDDGLRSEVAEKVHEAGADEQIEIPLVFEDQGSAERVKAQLDELKVDAHIEVDVDTGEAEVKIGELAAEAEIAKNKVQGIGEGSAESDMSRLATAVETLAANLEEMGNRANDSGDRVRNSGGAAGEASGGFGSLGSMMMFAVGAAVVLAPALAALPALMSGLGLGGIALAGAFKDVVGALTAANQASGSAGQSSAQLAQTEFSNAVAIRNAQQSIADAHRQAAIAAQNSADSIASASQQVVQAEQSQQIAAQQLAQAQIDAVNQIADLNNGAADATNSVQDAQLGVQQAQQNLDSVMSNSLSTDLQKKQAQQALVDAEQALTDAKQRAKEATQAADKANQEGVANFPPVVQAQRAYQQAVLATADAQHQLQIAQRNAADQMVSSAESVQKAEQSLTDTLKQQQLAAAAAQQSTGGANSYAQAMAKLTPVGQQVVLLLRQMSQGFAATAQNAVLPGILTFLQDIDPLIPQFAGALSQAGRAVGGVAAQFGALFANRTFASQFFTVLQQGSGLITQIGGGLAGMFQRVTEAAASAGPIVQAVGSGLSDLLVGIGSLLQGLASGGAGAAQTIQSILDLAAGLLGPLGTLVGAISGSLGPAFKVLEPVVLTFVNTVVKALMPSMPQLSNALLQLADIIGLLVPALTPLVGIMGDGLAVVLQIVGDALMGINEFVQQNISWVRPLITVISAWVAVQWLLNAAMDANPIGAVITLIVALVGGIVYAYDHFKWFHDFIQNVFLDLHNWFFDFWHTADGIWHDVISGAEWMAEWFEALPGRLGRLGGQLWGWIGEGLKEAANGAIWVLNGMIDSLNDLLHGLSDTWSWAGIPAIPPVPEIPYLADGGRIGRGGWVTVGDRGEENLFLPAGAEVQPLSHRPVQGGGGITVTNLNLSMNMTAIPDFSRPNSMDASARKFAIQIRDALRQLEEQYS